MNKSLKKLFSLALALALVFSSGLGVGTLDVQAAEANTFTDVKADHEFYDYVTYLAEEDITTGYTTGEKAGTFGVNETLTRNNAAVFLIRALGTELGTYKGTFADVKQGTSGALHIEAAAELGLVKGYTKDGVTEFRPQETVTRGQFAKMVAVAYDLQADASKTLTMTDLAGNTEVAYIKAVLDNDVVGGYPDNTYRPNNGVTRGHVSKFIYNAEHLVPEVKELKVVSVSAISAKGLKVTFNKSLSKEDQAKVTFDVKRGTTKVVLTPTWAEDGKSVTLASTIKLVKGEYTVTAAGVEFAEKSNTGKVTVETEKASQVMITSDNVAKANPATVKFEIKNQYGEVMNITSGIIASAYDKTDVKANDGSGLGSVAVAQDGAKQQLTGNFSAGHIVAGDEVLVNISYQGLTATKTLNVIDETAVASLEFGAVSPLEGKTRITVGEVVEIPYTASDAFGNVVKLAQIAANADGATNQEKIGDWLFTSSDKTVIDIDAITVDAKGKLEFTAAGKGTAKITAVNVKTGAVTSTNIEVFVAAEEDTIALTAPSELVVAGEKVKVPFTAYDQFGNAISTAKLNTGKVSLASSDNSKATVAWVGKEIVITGAGAGTTEISATIGTNVVKFSIDVQAAAVPTVVTGVKNIPSILTDGAEASIKVANLVIKDQYNRDYKLKGTEGAIVYLKDGTETSLDLGDQSNYTKDGSDDTNANAALIKNDDTAYAKIKGKSTAGDETLVIQLTSDVSDAKANLVAGSKLEYKVTTKAGADITSFTLDTVPTLYATGSSNTAGAKTYAQDLVVTAKDANGNVVAIPSSDILSVTSSDSAKVVVDKATMKVAGKGKGTANVTVLVKKADGTTQSLTQAVTVSDVAPLAETIAFKDVDGKLDIAAASVGTINTTTGATELVITDQYGGKELKADDIVVNTIIDAGSNNTYSYDATNGILTVTNGASGDKFVLTAVSNGKTATLEVTVIP